MAMRDRCAASAAKAHPVGTPVGTSVLGPGLVDGVGSPREDRTMPKWDYKTVVLTGGFMGRHSDELRRGTSSSSSSTSLVHKATR